MEEETLLAFEPTKHSPGLKETMMLPPEKKCSKCSTASRFTKLIDAFYKDWNFGTGGLRGIMGAGSNRMNIYTVGSATQGLSNIC